MQCMACTRKALQRSGVGLNGAFIRFMDASKAEALVRPGTNKNEDTKQKLHLTPQSIGHARQENQLSTMPYPEGDMESIAQTYECRFVK